MGGKIDTIEGQQSPECSFPVPFRRNILHFSRPHKPVTRVSVCHEPRPFCCALSPFSSLLRRPRTSPRQRFKCNTRAVSGTFRTACPRSRCKPYSRAPTAFFGSALPAVSYVLTGFASLVLYSHGTT